MGELKLEILRKLEFGHNLYPKLFKVEKCEYNKAIKELSNEGYVTYEAEKNELFKDDVKNIVLTKKGKDFILNYNN